MKFETRSHIDPVELLPGDRVFGVVSLSLAAKVCERGGQVHGLCLQVPLHRRGYELSADEFMACRPQLVRFDVSTLWGQSDAIANVWKPVIEWFDS